MDAMFTRRTSNLGNLKPQAMRRRFGQAAADSFIARTLPHETQSLAIRRVPR